MSSTHGKIKLNRWNNGKVIVQILPPQTFIREQQNIREFAQNIHQQMQSQIQQLDAELANQPV